jgi:hypothetical protein
VHHTNLHQQNSPKIKELLKNKKKEKGKRKEMDIVMKGREKELLFGKRMRINMRK